MQIDKNMKGCIVFTSSAAACIPSPFGVTYAATKSFLSSFGASLAPEVKKLGIDVMVAHPSPVSSRYCSVSDWPLTCTCYDSSVCAPQSAQCCQQVSPNIDGSDFDCLGL